MNNILNKRLPSACSKSQSSYHSASTNKQEIAMDISARARLRIGLEALECYLKVTI